MRIGWLQSDAASMIALTIVERHGEGMTEEGRQRLYRQLVEIVLAGLQSYEIQVERMQRRMLGAERSN